MGAPAAQYTRTYAGADEMTPTSGGRSTIVAIGPWLFTIAALILITQFGIGYTGRAVMADFRAMLIYAFSISLVAAAPIVIVVSRLLSDIVFAPDEALTRISLVPAAAIAFAASAAMAYAAGYFAGLPSLPRIALTYATGLVGAIWIGVAATGVLKDFRAITFIFLAGLAFSVAAALTVAAYGADAASMTLAFSIGTGIIAVSLMFRAMFYVRDPTFDFARSLHRLGESIVRYRLVCVGAFAGVLALWIDKWIIWLGPAGERVSSGLVHSPAYDGASFVASLTMIPALALFIKALDQDYISVYRSYYVAIGDHASLDEVTARQKQLQKATLDLIESIFVRQAAIATIVVFTAPLIVSLARLPFSSVGVLRLCAIAVLFQLVFLAATSLLLFFARYRAYFALQVLLLALTALGTTINLHFDPSIYGFGLLVAAVFSGGAAYIVLCQAVGDLDYLTFVDGAIRMQVESKFRRGKQEPSTFNF